MSLYFALPEAEFAPSRLADDLGSAEGALRWTLGEAGQPYHSHASVERIQADQLRRGPGTPEDAEAPEDFYAIELSVYRVPAKEHDPDRDLISEERFFQALASAAPDLAELECTAAVDLYYSAADSKWRIGLLASPPEFGELGSDLGTVSLGGLSLQFSDSKVGLVSASLDISPFADEFRTGITFHHTAQVGSLANVCSEVIDRATDFSSLFIAQK